ncbi:tyrosine-type recombinase/integrase [Erwinia amylovora]|uniref:tyrosine-type recombinase/integrase n=1 Tax=Erwinia amylovora TaxID=552 RepID=UPI000C06A21E|nr:site-specific integrase [Erwinia amylovora]
MILQEIDDRWEELMKKYFFFKMLREDTEWSYRKVVSNLRSFLGPEHSPDLITEWEVLSWRRYLLKEKQRSVHTWNNKVAHMRALYNFWSQKGYVTIKENPFNGVSAKAVGKRKKTLSKKQITTICLTMEMFAKYEQRNGSYGKKCALFPTWYWMVVIDTLRYTGMRLNQLFHIRLRDINLDEGWIELRTEGSKTYREWRIPVVRQLVPGLKMLLEKAREFEAEGDDPLFHYERFVSTRYNRHLLTKMPSLQPLRSFFNRLSSECGFTVSPHRFRHSLATLLMTAPDRNIQMVKGLLGHRSLSTTMEYIDIDIQNTGRTLEMELSLHMDKKKVSGFES